MAGAMRKMGIYLGLVEDDDARAYGRYDTRHAEGDHYDRLEERRYPRYAEDGYAADGEYDDRYDVADRYEADYRGGGYRADDRFADLDADLPPAPDPAFARLAALAERIRADHPGARDLSAGMTADIEEAVAAGSTLLRVGTALFGTRPLPSPEDESHRSHGSQQPG